ncbi:MAG TPA: TGS domain-containing protein, partial [Chitinophagales bacterium]|nr:TGS domain-containing protein [Chitinophagales bacterium]
MSIKITFPDGAVKEFNEGITALEIAGQLSNSLPKKVLGAEINGEVQDATRPITSDATLKLLTWNDTDGKSTFWHSSAHLMAEAIESLFTGVKFGIGPPIENGFYYDIDTGDKTLSLADLEKIEKKMLELAAKKNEYIRKSVAKADAIQYFTEKGDEYKLELLEGLEDGQITFYTQGNFTDLCRGPHIPNTGHIKAIKLMKLAGAYWRGDEKRKQLTRIYGVTFPNQQELDDYLKMLEEAEKRDHRKLGQQLEIYTFDEEVGPGLPLWLPN